VPEHGEVRRRSTGKERGVAVTRLKGEERRDYELFL